MKLEQHNYDEQPKLALRDGVLGKIFFQDR